VASGRLQLVASNDLLAELAEVVQRTRFASRIKPEDVAALRNLYSESAICFEPGPNPNVCRDPRDDYLLALAAASRADYLVTRDEDLLILGRFESTEIVYPARFLQLLASPPSGASSA
jgi:putative PIN family toxin of toxin-antitoxin system